MSIPGAALAWVQALGWSLLHFVWQGLLVGLLFALTRSLVARENSSLRYAVGLLALSVLALCPPLTLWLLRPEGEAAGIASVLVAQAGTVESIGTLATTLESGVLLNDLLPALVLVWVFGVSVMIWRAVHQWRALDRIATTLAYRQADIEAMLIRVADRFGGMHGTRVLVSRFMDTPTLIGWFKPVILLPAAVVIGFPRQQLELILAHELGHLRRHDHLVNLGQAVVETLLFYHPVVHWISREIRHEREICCDNLVLSLTDSEPREYARTLEALEQVRQMSPQLAVAASGGMLLDRVRRIVGAAAPRNGDRHPHAIAWGVVAVCAVAVSAMVLPPQGEQEQSAGLFEQPQSPDLSGAELNIALIPVEPSLEFGAIRAPIVAADSTRADQIRNVPIEVAGTDNVAASPATNQANPPAVALKVPAVERFSGESPALPEVANLELHSVPLAPAIETARSVGSSTPVLVHQVAPDYPDNGRGGSRAKVGFAFSIDRAGRVRNIRSVSGDTQSAFAVAARNALRQWKFDPHSIAVDGVKNFRQDFEFISASRALGDEKDAECIAPTGSHVCRPGRGIGVAFKAEEKAAATSQSDGLAAVDAESADKCVQQTGSRVCRPLSESEIALNSQLRAETASQTIVLAGGSH